MQQLEAAKTVCMRVQSTSGSLHVWKAGACAQCRVRCRMAAAVCPKPASCLQAFPGTMHCMLLSVCLCLQVTALETRVLQLQADEEVAAVTAGPEAQTAAAHALQQAQAALTAVERVSEGCGGNRSCCLTGDHLHSQIPAKLFQRRVLVRPWSPSRSHRERTQLC